MPNENKLQTKLILEEYFNDITYDDFDINKISSGICNETYMVRYKRRDFIL